MNPLSVQDSYREFHGPAAPDAGVVHDLGNLIQVAASAINIVGREQRISPRAVEAVAGARASLAQAGGLVRQVIREARGDPDAGEATNLVACLTELETLVLALEADLLLHVRIGPGVRAVACEAAGLKSALLNLVFNARDAMAGAGLVSIRAMRALQDGTAMVDIQVADTGVGMSPDTIARAFDPFFTTKCDGLGGVGLPMVERFARVAGGAVSIDSAPGIGTTVTLRLPASPPDAASLNQDLIARELAR